MAAATLFSEDFSDNSAGWTLGPTSVSIGHTNGGPDPGLDHTPTADNGVGGANLGGNITTALHPFYYLTSPAINASGPPTVYLQFWRWLNSDYTPYLQNVVEVYDGATWITVWASGGPPGVNDTAWTQQTIDISAYANASMQVRWGHSVGSAGSFTVSGWNVDDVLVVTSLFPNPPRPCSCSQQPLQAVRSPDADAANPSFHFFVPHFWKVKDS